MFTLFDDLPASNGEAEGKRLRDEALAILRARSAALIRDLQAAALRIAFDRGEVCADDVRALVPITAGISPKVVGAAFRELADAGILTQTGEYVRSRRPEAHARSIPVWRLADGIADEARGDARLLRCGIYLVRIPQSGKLPEPVRRGGRVVWRMDKIRVWLATGAPDSETWAAIREAAILHTRRKDDLETALADRRRRDLQAAALRAAFDRGEV